MQKTNYEPELGLEGPKQRAAKHMDANKEGGPDGPPFLFCWSGMVGGDCHFLSHRFRIVTRASRV